MLPFIVVKLQAVYGDQWWEQGVARGFRSEDIERLQVQFEKRHDSLVVERPGEELAEMLDINWFGNILESNWKGSLRTCSVTAKHRLAARGAGDSQRRGAP